VVAFALLPSLPYTASSLYLVSSTPVDILAPSFASPDAWRTKLGCSIDCFVRFWEGEALSQFRRSAWVGKFLTTLLDLPLSAHVVYYSGQSSSNIVSLFDHHSTSSTPAPRSSTFQASQRLTAMFCSTFGYASIRLGGYGSADEQFLRAHRINSRRIALRLALHDLRVMIRTRPLRKRSRYEASTERCQVVTKTYFSRSKASSLS
jgi:hypothetical protein